MKISNFALAHSSADNCFCISSPRPDPHHSQRRDAALGVKKALRPIPHPAPAKPAQGVEWEMVNEIPFFDTQRAGCGMGKRSMNPFFNTQRRQSRRWV